MSGSPHDNLPDLEGDVYTITVRVAEPVEIDGESRDELAFTSIQPSKGEAFKRAVYMARVEWGATVTDLVEVEQHEGDRDEIVEDFVHGEMGKMQIPETVKQEVVDHLQSMPMPAAISMFQNFPEHVQAEFEEKLPAHFVNRISTEGDHD